MKKSRLLLYIGLPILGLSWLVIPGVAIDPSYPASSLILILIYIDVIPYIISLVLADMGSPIIPIKFLTVMVHVAFWLPVAHGINMLWGHLEKRSKRNIRRDGLRFSVK
ncbi:MAG: hypothetical protein EB829_04765 [Nitrosopumilus sp. H8]|nr:MAG: hypothetical protein EB829_04765 [Nitrosopumilus sp. H8]